MRDRPGERGRPAHSPASAGVDVPLPERIAAFDCETTGLDPAVDHIIQIAVVVASPQGREWSTLVDPGAPVPLAVQRLTGIRTEDLRGAPPPAAALAEFLGVVEDLPLVAHNAPFDRAFVDAGLRRYGLPPLRVPVFDTLELARLADPLAPSLRLDELSARHGRAVERAHDALSDARAAAAMFAVLTARLRDADPRLLQTLRWLLADAYGDQASLVRGLAAAAGAPGGTPAAPVFAAYTESSPGRPRRGAAAEGPGGQAADVSLDTAALAALLRPGSVLAHAVGSFELRPGQIEMMTSVARAMADRRHLVVEAGTGTGKTMAYLLPAMAWARASGERVTVSTHTLNLQEQLTEKDVPAIVASGALPGAVALLKGRSQYACLKAWDERRAGPAEPGEADFLARFAAWLAVTATGDRGELQLFGDDEERWSLLSADAIACTGRRCPFYDPCFLFRARRRAEAADVVVVNHALMLADLRGGRAVLPESRYLVIDEAHHLADLASEHLGHTVGERAVERYFRLLDRGGGPGMPARGAPGRRGILPALRSQLQPLGLIPENGARADRAARRVAAAGDALALAREGAAGCFAALRSWLMACGRHQADRSSARLPKPADQSERHPLWQAVAVEGERFGAGLRQLGAALQGVAAALEDDDGAMAAERAVEVRAVAEQAGELADALEACLVAAEDWVAWAEAATRGSRSGEAGAVVMRACPVDPADLLTRLLFAPAASVTLTSATLSIRGDCGYLRRRAGLAQGQEAERTDERVIGSPFDFRSAALLCLPDDMPTATSLSPERYSEAVAPWLLRILAPTRGHALLLFTSNRVMRAVRDGLRPGLEAEGIACLAQGVDGSRTALAAALRRNDDTVVLGSASFWEGVDVRGDGLRLLVIVQLPFRPPDMPLEQARQEAVAARGGHPFRDLQLPAAVLRFKQGFGRLIRSGTDRGAAVVLDPRVATAGYGSVFVASLPGPTVRRGAAESMARELARWFVLPAGGSTG